MSRSLTSTTLRALYAPETAESFLILLTVSHANLSVPLRVTNNAQDIISRSNTFVAYPFELSLPDDQDQRPPRARLKIDNVDRQIVQAIRGLSSAPTVLIEIIRAASPDVVEARFQDFRLSNITYDSHVIEGDLTIEDFTAEPFPSGIFSPLFFPALF
jgi:hypothetical protein